MDETRVVKHLLQGFCTHDEGTSAYFIPSFEDKDNVGSGFIMDLVIFEITETKARGKKLYEGYQGRITFDNLQNQAIPDVEDPEVLKEQLMKAVYHRDGFYAEISSSMTSTFVEFYWKEDEDSPKRVCRAPLIRVDIAIPAGQVLEATLLSLERASDTCLATKSLTVDLDDQQKELQKRLNELVVEKNRMEDRMLRAFTVAMNAQKEGYRELHQKYLSLLERLKKNDGISDEITQDQQSAITVDDDSDSELHSDYDMETDIEEITPNTDEARKKRRKVHRIIEDSGSESEGFEDRRKTGVVKNLFTESATQKPETSTASQNADTVEENDDDTDFGESQEIYVPQAKRPTTYKSPFKASNTAEDETTPKKTKETEAERKESDGGEAATTEKPVNKSLPARSTRSKTSNSLKLLSSVFPDSQ